MKAVIVQVADGSVKGNGEIIEQYQKPPLAGLLEA
jgi:hypothetical protein